MNRDLFCRDALRRDVFYGLDFGMGFERTTVVQARRDDDGGVTILNMREVPPKRARNSAGAGQLSLWRHDGSIAQGWVGLSGNARQRRRARRALQAGGLRAELHRR